MSDINISQNDATQRQYISELKTIEDGTECATCGHDPYEVKTPFKTLVLSIFTPSSLRMIATLMAGVSLYISNYYLIPVGAWANPSTRLSVIMTLAPSFALFIMLFCVGLAIGSTGNSASLLLRQMTDRLFFMWLLLISGTLAVMVFVVVAYIVDDWSIFWGLN